MMATLNIFSFICYFSLLLSSGALGNRSYDIPWIGVINRLHSAISHILCARYDDDWYPNGNISATVHLVHLDDIIDLISNVSTVVTHHYSRRLQRMHQYGLCSDFYMVILELRTYTQRQLVLIMKTILSQNIKLSIGLETFVWERFFELFYKSTNQYRDNYICQLLGMMQSEGSYVTPNLSTFNQILYGISINEGIGDPQRLMKLIIDEIMKDYGIKPDEASLYSVFRAMRRSDNRIGAEQFEHWLQRLDSFHDDGQLRRTMLSELQMLCETTSIDYDGDECGRLVSRR